MDEQQKQTILDIPKVIAVGIASPVATVLTSRFGVAGTLIGLALSAVILTALADMLKVYLARAPATVAKVPTTVVKMPGGLRARLSWHNVHSRLRAAFARFLSLPPASARRRSVLIGSIVAAGISFFVGLTIVTGLELGVGQSLSCWVWNDCPEESSTDGSGSARASTLPSVLGGGQSASSSTPQVEVSPSVVSPSSPQQEEPGSSPSTPGAPSSQVPDAPGVETPDPSVQQQGPSEVIEEAQQDVEEAQQDVEEAQQQIPSSSAPADDSEGQK